MSIKICCNDNLAGSYEAEQAKLKGKIQEIEEQISSVAQDNENLEKFLVMMKNFTCVTELTPEILYTFIDRIEIGEKDKVKSRKNL